MKLIRYYWKRPCEYTKTGFTSGVFSEECGDDNIQQCIEKRKINVNVKIMVEL